MNPRTFADLLRDGDGAQPLLVGAERTYTLDDLRGLATTCRGRWAPGAGVMLYRAPGTPEAPVAAALIALLAAGVRVYLPARITPVTARDLEHLRPSALLSDRRADGWASAADRDRLAGFAQARGIPHLDLAALEPAAVSTPIHRPPIEDLLCLVTSGSGGAPSAVRYDEAAWMACGAAFEGAGLLAPALLGGPGLCPGLAHSMGVRAVLLALWCRQPLLFIQPEWVSERPAEVARLLMTWPPSHLTGGPGLLGLLPELQRVEPRLRRVVRRLRVLVSSGAPFDPGLAERLPGVRLANAFGTTETQQVSTTLLDPDAPLETLGRPLPGVAWRVRDGMLEVRSPFGARGPLGAPDWDPWYAPGDRITVDPDGRFRHAGRRDAHVSTGLGVEVALGPVAARYRDLPDGAHLVLATHPECPGLLGLAFVPADTPTARARLKDALRARAEVHPPTAPFDADRLHAVALVTEPPPLIGPGKIDRRGALAAHRQALDALIHTPKQVGFELSAPPAPAWPRRSRALAAAALNWCFEAGHGDTLIARRGGARIEVLDLVGGFGVNLLGHDNAAVRAAARSALGEIPIADQGSARDDERRLCAALGARLAAHTGRPYALALASTGAEAVDLALRHALLTRRARVLSFHAELRARHGAGQPARVREIIAYNLQANHFDVIDRERKTRRAIRQLEGLGYTVQITSAA